MNTNLHIKYHRPGFKCIVKKIEFPGFERSNVMQS